MKDHGTRSFAAYHMAAIVTLCLALGAVESAAAAGPVTGLDLVLWLDAQDIEGKGNASNQPPQGQAIAAWADKSTYRNDARQTTAEQRPTYVRDALEGGLQAVHFEAAKRQHLSAGNAPSLELPLFTTFIVAQAAKSGGDMWLLSKNDWGPPWTGYGIAISKEELHPWLHLGLETGARGYFQFRGEMSSGFRIVEVSYDGKIAQGCLELSQDGQQAITGNIARNNQALTIGAMGSQFLEGGL